MKIDHPPTVLFLCTGNYYRSRFAELYFNALAIEHGSRWRADSRGLRIHPGNVGPISTHTIRWLTDMGIALPDPLRFPIPIAEDDLASAQLVVAIKEAEHRPLLEANHPAWAERVEYWHIHDLDVAMPESALPLLRAKVKELMKRLT
jgi:protein-tyrosine phosphatase